MANKLESFWCKKCKSLGDEEDSQGAMYCSKKKGMVPKHVIDDKGIDNFCPLVK